MDFFIPKYLEKNLYTFPSIEAIGSLKDIEAIALAV